MKWTAWLKPAVTSKHSRGARRCLSHGARGSSRRGRAQRPVTRVQLPRSPVKFPLDRAHDYDLLFLRHYRKLEPLLRDFRPDVVQITGPSDVGTLGAYVAHKMKIRWRRRGKPIFISTRGGGWRRRCRFFLKRSPGNWRIWRSG